MVDLAQTIEEWKDLSSVKVDDQVNFLSWTNKQTKRPGNDRDKHFHIWPEPNVLLPNVWVVENLTKRSSNTLLCLVRFSETQTLWGHQIKLRIHKSCFRHFFHQYLLWLNGELTQLSIPPIDLHWFFEISIRTEKKIQL